MDSDRQGSEASRRDEALMRNLQAARGLQSIMKSNLGPKGTLKMLVSGSGSIKLTKDGNVLLHEMSIVHPTASLIARAAAAQDEFTGDGTTTNVMLVGELLWQCGQYLSDGVHARVLVEGFELAKDQALAFLEKYKCHPLAGITDEKARLEAEKTLMEQVARVSLRTKVSPVAFADQLASIVTGAIEVVRNDVVGSTFDLHMVEIMQMPFHLADETQLVRGLVLDHGARHHDMPRRVANAYLLVCNVSMEYEKSEVNSSLTYSSAAERVEMAAAERSRCDEIVKQAIALLGELRKKDPTANLVVINQKGIDPPALQMFADAGILALRRAKRRNMERLTHACGGVPLNTLDGATIDQLGHADVVYEQTIGEDKYTFVEGCRFPRSCTILIKGSDQHTMTQIKDALRDGLRAAKNLVDDGFAVVAGAGAFEVACAQDILRTAATSAGLGKARLGMEAYAHALEVVPKTLASNAGLDAIDTLLAVQGAQNREHEGKEGKKMSYMGVGLEDGNPIDAAKEGIWDNVIVKQRAIQSATVIAQQLLLVDVVLGTKKEANGAKKHISSAGPMM